MSEYIIHVEDAKTLYNLTDFGFPLEAYLSEEIVRCRECKHFNEKTYKWVNDWTRTSTTCAMFDGCHVTPDGFCAWGERRDANE